jgi:tRNA A-37 threonylcarbamoyl transferase component Bud32
VSSIDKQAPPSSELVANKYRVTRLIGRGGMGSVWEGIHVTLGNRVAIKFIETDYADNEEARTRFENEARAAAKLNSKHVVQVFDYGVMPDGRPFIVMEYLSGESLDARLERCGCMSLAETTRIITQVGRALVKAHASGIVHRDLKPENIFLVHDDDDGTDIAKVVDFGIAKFTDTAMGVSSSTRTGSVLGTPYYMSPEQARGLRSVDYRSDLWSLGVIVFRCLTGRYPFEGEAIGDLLVKICTAALPIPSQVASTPPAFDAWFEKAMQRDPALRFSTATELAEQLTFACGLGGSSALHPNAPFDVTGLAQNNLGEVARNAKEQTGIPLSRTLGRTQNGGKGGLALVFTAGAILVVASVGGLWWLVSRRSGAEHAASAAPPSAMSQVIVQPPAPSAAPLPVALATATAAPTLSGSAGPLEPAPVAIDPVRRPMARAVAGGSRASITQSRSNVSEPPPTQPVSTPPPVVRPRVSPHSETDLGY